MATLYPIDAVHPEPASYSMGLGRPARVAVSWSMAGGILAVLPVALLDSGSHHNLIPITSGLFVFGAAVGFVTGAVLGAFGRVQGRSARDAARSVCLGVLVAVPCLAAAALAAFWISMTVVAEYVGAITAYAGVASGWLAGGLVMAWAVIEGFIAVRAVVARWLSWGSVEGGTV
jgi:hypothetical protein